MRRIGLIGGMSWESTALYYRLLNQGTARRLGGLHSAECLLYSVDFADIERMQVDGRWDEAGDRLADAARRLHAAGADVLVLCTNTMHKVADRIQDAVPVPLLHIADSTADAVRRHGVGTVGLLGTAFTMEQPFLRERLEARGLGVLVPDAGTRQVVHQVIYDELCRGIVRDESREALRGVLADLVTAGAQGIVLGCTELELLLGPEDSEVPVFATTEIHVEAALDQALGPVGG